MKGKNNLFVTKKLNKELEKIDKKFNYFGIFQYVTLVVAVLAISSGTIWFKDYLTANSIRKEMESYNIATSFEAEETTINNENAEIIENTNSEIAVQKVSTSSSKKSSIINFNKYDENVIGSIYIPSVGVNGIIKNGIEYSTLERYVGLYENDVKPGETGNLALFAHNNTYAQIFKDLHNVNIGDKIEITTKEGKYTYKVTNKYVIKPSDLSVLNDSDEKEITLITCNSDGSHRVVVKGVLI